MFSTHFYSFLGVSLRSPYFFPFFFQTSMDQLHMHVTSAVHNTAWNVVYGHAVLSSSSNDAAGDSDAEMARRPYADLCGGVAEASVLPCLVDLCRALWGIMSSYRRISQWHAEEYRKKVS